MVHLITIEVTNQTWWGLCGSVFPPSLFLSLPVNLAKVNVRADHRIRWKNINHGHTQYSWVCYPSSWPSTIDHCWREKQRSLIRPTSTQVPGGEEAWRTIIFNNRIGKWWLYLFVTSYHRKCFCQTCLGRGSWALHVCRAKSDRVSNRSSDWKNIFIDDIENITTDTRMNSRFLWRIIF